MSEQVQQEGSFKMPKKKAPQMKKLDAPSTISKVDLTIKPVHTDAVQEQSTNESVLVNQGPEVGLQEVGKGNTVNENAAVKIDHEEEVVVINEITDEEVNREVAKIEETVRSYNEEKASKPLPENIEKLVNFMEETGGTVEDYVRLNADYSSVNGEALLKEYYKKSRPHLDAEEIEFLMEDKFSYDEDKTMSETSEKRNSHLKKKLQKLETF